MAQANHDEHDIDMHIDVINLTSLQRSIALKRAGCDQRWTDDADAHHIAEADPTTSSVWQRWLTGGGGRPRRRSKLSKFCKNQHKHALTNERYSQTTDRIQAGADYLYACFTKRQSATCWVFFSDRIPSSGSWLWADAGTALSAGRGRSVGFAVRRSFAGICLRPVCEISAGKVASAGCRRRRSACRRAVVLSLGRAQNQSWCNNRYVSKKCGKPMGPLVPQWCSL